MKRKRKNNDLILFCFVKSNCSERHKNEIQLISRQSGVRYLLAENALRHKHTQKSRLQIPCQVCIIGISCHNYKIWRAKMLSCQIS